MLKCSKKGLEIEKEQQVLEQVLEGTKLDG
jgi:hypothetical protein